VSQYDQYQSAPPPNYPAEQSGYGQPAYGQPGYQPQKTNTMAILGLVFAFVFSPLGIVFSAIGLKQIKERREGGRGLALSGLILSIIFVVLGILIVVLAATVFSTAVTQAAQDSAAASTAAAPADDPEGVVTACQVIVPAVVNLESDLSTVESAEDYATVMGALRTTIEAAAGQSTDPTFVAHVQTLSKDFQQAIDTVNAGGDPSTLEGALSADGTQIDNDCAAAGYVQ
jgi:peptidyl-prolyl cis-trans isomerase B (cyclophilin B)